jgi:very-short-patch-repair endonuclease
MLTVKRIQKRKYNKPVRPLTTLPLSRLPTQELDQAAHVSSGQVTQQREANIITFEELNRSKNQKTKLHKVIAEKLNAKSLPTDSFSDKNIQKAYNLISLELSKNYSLRDIRESRAELLFCDYLKRSVEGRRKINEQVWIGPYNVDFFLPWGRTSKSLGLIIEVGGEIYNDAIKSIKFDHKISHISDRLKIPIMFLSKWEATYQKANCIIKDILSKREISTGTKNRLWRKIWIETIACWLDSSILGGKGDEIFLKTFGLDLIEFNEFRYLIISHKKTCRLEKINNNR